MQFLIIIEIKLWLNKFLSYLAKIIKVREKRAEFVLLKCTFVRRASEFLRNYFPSLIDSMLNDKANFSQVNLTSKSSNMEVWDKTRIFVIIYILLNTCSEVICRGLTMLIWGTNAGLMHGFYNTSRFLHDILVWKISFWKWKNIIFS